MSDEPEDPDGGLLAIDIDPDNYASASSAAHEPSSVSHNGHTNGADDNGSEEEIINPRTYQSETTFQQVKAGYQAKHDDGNAYADLLAAVPVLRSEESTGASDDDALNGHAEETTSAIDTATPTKVSLDKRTTQLLGYAAAELYFAGNYGEVISLCERVKSRCELRDVKAREAVERWIDKAQRRMEKGDGSGG